MLAAKEKTISSSLGSTFTWSPRGSYVPTAASPPTTMRRNPFSARHFTELNFKTRKSEKSPIGSKVKSRSNPPWPNQHPRGKTLGENHLQLRQRHLAPEMSQYRAYFVPTGVDPLGTCAEECNVNSFVVSQKATKLWKEGGGLSFISPFKVEATFDEPCGCCEIRQHILQQTKRIRYMRIVDGPNGPDYEPFPNGMPVNDEADLGEGEEDCNETGCYGHKDNPAPPPGFPPIDSYSNDGCKYCGTDNPGFGGIEKMLAGVINQGAAVEITYHARFNITIIDVCNDDRFVDSKILDVGATEVIDRVKFLAAARGPNGPFACPALN